MSLSVLSILLLLLFAELPTPARAVVVSVPPKCTVTDKGAETCAHGEVWNPCGGARCEPKCGGEAEAEVVASECDVACRPDEAACVCAIGLARSQRTGKCVQPDRCDKGAGAMEEVCGANEEWHVCGADCEPNCKKTLSEKCQKCDGQGACVCMRGFVRSTVDGLCRSQSDMCPAPRCRINERRTPCGRDCEIRCPGESIAESAATDENECACRSGFARSPFAGICVPVKECVTWTKKRREEKEMLCSVCPPLHSCVLLDESSRCSSKNVTSIPSTSSSSSSSCLSTALCVPTAPSSQSSAARRRKRSLSDRANAQQRQQKPCPTTSRVAPAPPAERQTAAERLLHSLVDRLVQHIASSAASRTASHSQSSNYYSSSSHASKDTDPAPPKKPEGKPLYERSRGEDVDDDDDEDGQGEDAWQPHLPLKKAVAWPKKKRTTTTTTIETTRATTRRPKVSAVKTTVKRRRSRLPTTSATTTTTTATTTTTPRPRSTTTLAAPTPTSMTVRRTTMPARKQGRRQTLDSIRTAYKRIVAQESSRVRSSREPRRPPRDRRLRRTTATPEQDGDNDNDDGDDDARDRAASVPAKESSEALQRRMLEGRQKAWRDMVATMSTTVASSIPIDAEEEVNGDDNGGDNGDSSLRRHAEDAPAPHFSWTTALSSHLSSRLPKRLPASVGRRGAASFTTKSWKTGGGSGGGRSRRPPSQLPFTFARAIRPTTTTISSIRPAVGSGFDESEEDDDDDDDDDDEGTIVIRPKLEADPDGRLRMETVEIIDRPARTPSGRTMMNRRRGIGVNLRRQVPVIAKGHVPVTRVMHHHQVDDDDDEVGGGGEVALLQLAAS